MKRSITGRGRESNLSSWKFIWPWKSWQQILKGNRFTYLQIDAVEAMCFIVALIYVKVILFWQQLMGLHTVSVSFCFLDNFMCWRKLLHMDQMIKGLLGVLATVVCHCRLNDASPLSLKKSKS